MVQILSLFGTPDIEALNTLIINCRPMDTQTSSEQISKMQMDGLGYTNKEQDAEVQSQCNTNTEGIISDNINPMAIDNNNS